MTRMLITGSIEFGMDHRSTTAIAGRQRKFLRESLEARFARSTERDGSPAIMVVGDGQGPTGEVDSRGRSLYAPSGVDALASALWQEMGGEVEFHKADFQTLGRGAGFFRNSEMVLAGADVCYAYVHGGDRRAVDVIIKCLSVGIPVVLTMYSEGGKRTVTHEQVTLENIGLLFPDHEKAVAVGDRKYRWNPADHKREAARAPLSRAKIREMTEAAYQRGLAKGAKDRPRVSVERDGSHRCTSCGQEVEGALLTALTH